VSGDRAEKRNGTRPTSGRTSGMHAFANPLLAAASGQSLDFAEDTRDAEMGRRPRAAYRDPELATIPAIRAMRTKSESDDACIFVIKLAR
jgi:hypothetical protein